MLIYVEESIFSSPAKVLVNTVNTAGVMGKGIALQFKKLYPEMFDAYQEQCEAGAFDIGSLQLFKTPNKWVLNFPTKKHWRSPSRIEYIEQGLDTFVRHFRELEINAIAFPQLGCGNGELDWESQVRPVMEKHLAQLPIDIFVHIYVASEIPEHRITKEIKNWLRHEPRTLGVFEVWTDLFGTEMPEFDPSEEVPDGNLARDWHNAVMLRAIWGRLRSYGLISDIDVRKQFGDDGIELISRLVQLPYIERASFVAPATAVVAARPSTSELLDRSDAKGVRLVPEQIPHLFETRPLWA